MYNTSTTYDLLAEVCRGCKNLFEDGEHMVGSFEEGGMETFYNCKKFNGPKTWRSKQQQFCDEFEEE